MGRRRLLVVFVSMLALAATAAPAGAATPSLKAQFAPVNPQIKKIGADIGTAINGADKATDVQLAKAFAGLAQRAAASAGKVGKLKGATGANAITQRQLQLALAKGAIDLARIATAAAAHNANAAKAATIALIKDSKPITAARTSNDSRSQRRRPSSVRLTTRVGIYDRDLESGDEVSARDDSADRSLPAGGGPRPGPPPSARRPRQPSGPGTPRSSGGP